MAMEASLSDLLQPFTLTLETQDAASDREEIMGCFNLLTGQSFRHWGYAKSVREVDAALNGPVGYVATAGNVVIDLFAHGKVPDFVSIYG